MRVIHGEVSVQDISDALTADGFFYRGGFGIDFDYAGGHSGSTYQHRAGMMVTIECLHRDYVEPGADPVFSVFWDECEPISPLLVEMYDRAPAI